jgi:hypothetical protein
MQGQSAYPQPVVQKPGLGFPLARIAAVFSLACGAVLDLGPPSIPTSDSWLIEVCPGHDGLLTRRA